MERRGGEGRSLFSPTHDDDDKPMMTDSHQQQTILSLTFFILPILYLSHRHRRQTNETARYRKERADERAYLSALVKNQAIQPLRPPLPVIVRRVLSRCRFAYLSTVDVDNSTSHLSLMRFTYLPEEETIIMSTSVRTKKYDMLERTGGVALLVHDFSEQGAPSLPAKSSTTSSGEEEKVDGEYSITLNGNCSVVTDIDIAEQYRQIHLRNNPEYPQFIIGKDIAMLRVDVATARICNISDEVIKWNVGEALYVTPSNGAGMTASPSKQQQ